MTYGFIIRLSNKRAAEMLDTLESLIPLADTGSKYSDIADWLEEGRRQGLLKGGEYLDLRSIIAQEL